MKTSVTDILRALVRISGNNRGAAVVEMALVLPLLVALVLGLYEFSTAIAANNIITNMSREGANLAARSGASPADIMSALSETASQIDMRESGTIYLTRIQEMAIGSSGKGPQVISQYRWVGSALESAPVSKVWACTNSSSWDGDQCDIGPAIPSANRTAALDMELREGEELVVVEVFYVYRPVLKFFQTRDLSLYSRTML